MQRCIAVFMVLIAVTVSPLWAADIVPAGKIDFTTGAKPPADATAFSIHIEPARGVPNGAQEKGLDGNQIYISRESDMLVTHGELKVGDVILGVEGKRFEKDVINTWRTAVGRASAGEGFLWFTRWRAGQVAEVKLRTTIPPGDFTKDGERTDTHDWTLGPTGARGWIWGINLETTRARQILVTQVEAGSPADGILKEGDVILGVNGSLFTNDARLAFAHAITEAEKTENKGQLRLVHWRKGEQKEVIIPLKVLGSYSPTAPFNCPKTARIMDAQCAFLLKHGFGDGVVGDINALAALATGRPEFAGMLKAHADKDAPPGMKLNFDDGSGSSWLWGYHDLFLAEYYLATIDASVLPAIREYSVNIAKGQSGAGNWGHGMAQTAFNGGRMHGPLGGYGALNQPGLVCFLSLNLSRECGVNDREISDAIVRSTQFFGSYVNRGSIVYGDHPPGESHDDNGKSSIGAVAFDILGHKKAATFFSRMSVASWSVREIGHTGNFFSFMWGPLGAGRAGPEAVAAYMNELRWFVDLERRWDGSSVYQGGAGRSGPEHVYGNWDCTGARLLANCLPLKKLRITGKGRSVAERLTGKELKEVVELDRGLLPSNGDTLYAGRSTADLFKLLGSWSPVARVRAAKVLATRDEKLLPRLLKMVDGNDWNARYGACLTLQYMKAGAAEAVPALTRLLSSPDLETRVRAITALAGIGDAAKPAIPELLQLALGTRVGDPRELTQRALSSALFAPVGPGGAKGLLAEMDSSVDRTLVLKVIERLLQNQDGASRSVVSTIYPKLKFEELQSIFPAVSRAIVEPAPSGEMGSAGVRDNGLRWLAENHVKEAIPMIMDYAWNQQGWGSQVRMAQVMRWLERYGVYAKEKLPELKKLADWCRTEPNFPEDCRKQKTAAVEEAIHRIEAATEKPELTSMAMQTNEARGMHNGDEAPIGVTGIDAKIYKKEGVSVKDVKADTPAFGQFSKGDVILGVNGARLEDQDPWVALGMALTKAESTDGILRFEVRREQDATTNLVTITIPVLGAYGEAFPLNCEKTKKIIRRAAEFYAGKDRLKDHNHLNGVVCLFLLSTGDDKYVPRVKEYFTQFLKPDGSITGIGEMTWDNGYNGVACAEYYLRTGDRSVLPILQHYCDDAKRRQLYGSGWNHWNYSVNPTYEGGGGMMNPAGNQVLLTLVLGKMCGVDVDDKTLRGALVYFYRFIGHGIAPISDQRAWQSIGSLDRAGASAAVMHVAGFASGNTAIYRQAKAYLAMVGLTSWPANLWDTIWYDLTGAYRLERDPAAYHKAQQNYLWAYDLYRQPSGAFFYPPGHGSLDGTDAGAAVALALTSPLKTLCITGAKRSKFAKKFTLPEHLWGVEADLEFFSPRNNPDFAKYGAEEATAITLSQLPPLSRQPVVTNLELNIMLKDVRHARCEIRSAAAKSLCLNKHLGELEKLLGDPDPRVRRAALDGINDYAPWFMGSPVGGCALKAGEFTPAMIEAITAIMKNPKEAWYVADGAMLALSHAPVAAIEKNIPRILPWTTQDDWWMRDSAFMALMGLQVDEKLFVKYLPVLTGMIVKEDHFNPHRRMLDQMVEAIGKIGSDSPAGKLIRAGLSRAAVESPIPQDVGAMPYSIAGKLNTVEAVQAAVRSAPEDAALIAGLFVRSGHLKDFDTRSLINIVKGRDGYKEDRFLGLYTAIGKIPAQQQEKLSEVLRNDYLPELLKRFNTDRDEPDERLRDLIVDLTVLKKPDAGWQLIGFPKREERLWRFYSFDPLSEKAKLEPLVEPPKPVSAARLPPGLEKWYAPEFDDSQWKSGRTPIGVGVFKAQGHGRSVTEFPDRVVTNNSAWGDGQFLLARTTLVVTNRDYDCYRLNVLSKGAYHVFLNGKEVFGNEGASEAQLYSKPILKPEAIHLQSGTNTLAVLGNLGIVKDRKAGKIYTAGQMDLFLEGIRLSEIGLTRKYQ